MIEEVREGVTADRCDRCRGLWFDADELDRWLTGAAAVAPVPEAHIPRRGVSSRRCPRCAGAMETAGWTGLVLDLCKACGGLFVEANELLQLERTQRVPEGQSIGSMLRDACVSAGWTLLSAKALVILLMRFVR